MLFIQLGSWARRLATSLIQISDTYSYSRKESVALSRSFNAEYTFLVSIRRNHQMMIL
jgi:hypothetical protein